jgi:hypothetical protein
MTRSGPLIVHRQRQGKTPRSERCCRSPQRRHPRPARHHRPRSPPRRLRRARRVPPAVWNVFTPPGAGQRIRRLLALPGQPGLRHAARQLGIRHAILASQVRQLEDAAGTTLLRTSPDGTITLTIDGEQFARDIAAALDMLAATGH